MSQQMSSQEKVFHFVAGLILLVPVIFYEGWVVQSMWRWFVTPAFGVMSPSVSICAGLAGMWGVLGYSSTVTRNDEATLLNAVLSSAFVLTIGLFFAFFLHLVAIS